MSSSFLSAAERERWQRVPATIPQDDRLSRCIGDHGQNNMISKDAGKPAGGVHPPIQ
jgi:hypothetical protein